MVECPLHAAMGQLAQAAVLQHVLHLEGEWLPRPELLLALEGWAGVHALIRAHVCPATREAPLEPAELSSFVDDALAPLFTPAEAPLRAQLRRTIARCAACGLAEGCPLDATLSEESAGHEGIG
jgi:hypothetical protein